MVTCYSSKRKLIHSLKFSIICVETCLCFLTSPSPQNSPFWRLPWCTPHMVNSGQHTQLLAFPSHCLRAPSLPPRLSVEGPDNNQALISCYVPNTSNSSPPWSLKVHFWAHSGRMNTHFHLLVSQTLKIILPQVLAFISPSPQIYSFPGVSPLCPWQCHLHSSSFYKPQGQVQHPAPHSFITVYWLIPSP